MMKDMPSTSGERSSKPSPPEAPLRGDSTKLDPAPSRGKEPPGLYSNLAERPDVKALLAEIQKKLKPGEDPLYYALPEEPPDPATRLPDEARVYVAPTSLSAPVKHKTLDMQKVRVSAGGNPRAAVTQQMMERDVDADAVALMRPEPVAESRRFALHWWGVVTAVSMAVAGASAVVIIKGMRLQPAVEGNGAVACASGRAAAPQASAGELRAAAAKPSVEAVASASAATVAVPAKSAAARANGRRRGEDDPYAAATPAKTAAKGAPPPAPTPPPFVEETPEF
jgi:hypothetical protein